MNKDNIYTAPLSDLEGSKNNDKSLELATRWERLGASIIDAIIGAAITFPVMFATGIWDKAVNGSISIIETVSMGVYGFLMFMLIHGYFLAKNGQTVGKKLVGTKIVSVHSDTILPVGKIFLFRYLPITVASNVPVFGQFLAIIDALFIFRKSKQCIHDQIAGTRVIKKNAH